jgi:hypothetical protein
MKKTWTTIKDTTRQIQSYGWNRSFVGLTSWSDEEEEEEEGEEEEELYIYSLF